MESKEISFYSAEPKLVANRSCTCGGKLHPVQNGGHSACFFCEKCESIYLIKLVKLPKKKTDKMFVKYCREIIRTNIKKK